MIEAAVAVAGTVVAVIPNEIGDLAGVLVAASPKIGLPKGLWKGDPLLLTVVGEELVATPPPVDMFENPLNTEAVGAEVVVPKVGAIDGKAGAPKAAVVATGVVDASASVAILFTVIWPPNIDAASNGA